MVRWLALLAAGVAAAQEVAPETLLLSRIRLRMEENLRRLPNYTCLQTIERSRRGAASRKFELADVIRIEVALVNNKEMFAWPGSDQFDERDITDMVSGGSIGNGNFATHARSVFLTRGPSYEHQGERFREGRRTIRYGYRVARLVSGFKLRVRPNEGIVGYEGAFWVDADTLDLVWLEVRITDIPPQLPIASGYELLTYQRVKVSGSEFLLPAQSETILTGVKGGESRNLTRFSNCRQYAGESVVRFDEAPEEVAARLKPPERIVLPGNLDIELALEAPLEAGESAVGDLVRATVVRDVRRNKETIIPKGAVVLGRILRLQRLPGVRDPYWIAGIEFTRIEFSGKAADFRARMEAASSRFPQPAFTAGRGAQTWMTWNEPPPENPRIGMLYMRGERPKLNTGFRTWWRTESTNPEAR
jgi:hypothetical protein